jgi:ABC-2 type transport system ATP-binding protein
MEGRTVVIETKELSKRFGSVMAADSISLSVNGGEIFGLIGPNGAGKSTLIKMLTTLLPPTSGQARVAGFDLRKEAAKIRAHIGYVPQLVSADGNLTGYENLLMSARLYHIPYRERAATIIDALERVELKEARDRLVQYYSGGMIRRLEIAQAMLHKPKILFLDEPTVGLDPIARRSVWSHLRYLRDTIGTTILLTTHQMDEADELCDRIGIMHLGRLETVGTPEALKARLRPDATLDDVFIALSGYDVSDTGKLTTISRERRSAIAHG